MLKVADEQLLVDIAQEKTHEQDKVGQVMLFLPCVIFGLAADVQIIVSTYKYKPIALSKMPNPTIRPLMLAIGVISLLLSLLSFVFCLLVFGGFNSD